MKLTVKERFMVISLLPQKANVVTLRVADELKNSLAPSDEEIQMFAIKYPGQEHTLPDGTEIVIPEGSVFWNRDAEGEYGPIEIGIGATMKKIVGDVLVDMDSKSSLTQDHLPLYDKFVEPPVPEEASE